MQGDGELARKNPIRVGCGDKFMDVDHHNKSINVSKLIGISVIFENDLYELALFLIKMHRSQDEKANLKTRSTHQVTSSTVLGLAKYYAYLSNIPSDRIKEMVIKAGLSLGACIKDSP